MASYQEVVLKQDLATNSAATPSAAASTSMNTPIEPLAQQDEIQTLGKRRRDALLPGDVDNTIESETQPKRRAPSHMVVGIDFGMWAYGRSCATSDADPATVTASSTWNNFPSSQFKSPSVMAFAEDNPEHRAFRTDPQAAVGFNVTPDMISHQFGKGCIDKIRTMSHFDNRVLNDSIAKSIISSNEFMLDEAASMYVLQDLYAQAKNDVSAATIGFPQHSPSLLFVLTHPTRLSRQGRDEFQKLTNLVDLGTLPGESLKFMSETQAAAMASFINARNKEGHAAWRVYFPVGDWITVLDIGAWTVDATTEEITKNDPRVQLTERIQSLGGICGIVTLHLRLLELIRNKFGITDNDLPQSLVGRSTPFHSQCEKMLRTFTGNNTATAVSLPLQLPFGVAHNDYDSTFYEITLQVDEIKNVLDDWLYHPVSVMRDQWRKSRDRGHQVKTTVISGGGSLLPYVWAAISTLCQENGVKAVRPDEPIAANCIGAVISELSDGLIGQRQCRAHFGIKLAIDGEVKMRWLIKKGEVVDTTKPGVLFAVAGQFTLSIEDVMGQAKEFHLKIFTYDQDDREVTDPNEPGVEEIAIIILSKSNMSVNLREKLAQRMRPLDEDDSQNANLDVNVSLAVDESGRLYFFVKAGALFLGKGELRYDFTRAI